MKCFLCCVFERYDVSVLLEKTAFGGGASLKSANPSILTAACPCLVIHAGQKCPQFFGFGRSWMLNKLYFELVPQKEVLRERGLENTVVETRLPCNTVL